jgi:hypothetical protein
MELGAVQNVPNVVQQGCPMPPQVPHDPAPHTIVAPGAHAWPTAAQRGEGEIELRTQQPPLAQVLFGQHG